jgi:outer membrane protein OmpA-like peptidoglycan-associated protein
VVRLVFVVVVLALPCLAQPLAARSQWLLNPGAEHSLLVGTGKLLGAGQFRVGLNTHLLVEDASALSVRQHVALAWAPFSRLQVMAQAPVVLLQRPLVTPEQGVGRPFAGLRVGLLSPDWDDDLWLAVEAAVGVPGLEQADLVGRSTLPSGLVKLSSGVSAGTNAAVGLEAGARVGQNLVELEGGFTLAGQGVHLGGELTARGSVAVQSAPRGFVELLAGVRYRLRPIELSLHGGPGFGLQNALSGRLVFGLAFVNPKGEDEPDDVRPSRPDCTEGTPYRLDECPDLDWDRDGVKNGVDRCPKEPGEPENEGCPWPDRDGDGTSDPFDNCPDVRGPRNNAGCPPEEPQLVQLKKDRIEILEVILFEFNKADIKPESFPLLEQVAKVMNGHPELRAVRIEGHTDKVGSADYNRQLSAARALAVKTFLVDVGKVDGTRLSTRGYGFDRPVTTNETEEGRAQNRRVEFLILGTEALESPEKP